MTIRVHSTENDGSDPPWSHRAKSNHLEIRSAREGSSLFRLALTLYHIIHPLQSNCKGRLISTTLTYKAIICGSTTNVDLDCAVILAMSSLFHYTSFYFQFIVQRIYHSRLHEPWCHQYCCIYLKAIVPMRTAKEFLRIEKTDDFFHESTWLGPLLVVQGYLDPIRAKARAEKLVANSSRPLST